MKKAEKAGFKMEGKDNIMEGLDKFSKATGEGQHAKHPRYTNQVKNKLGKELKENPNMTPEQAIDVVKDIQSGARNVIENNPNTKVNDLKLNQQVAPVDNTKVVKPTDPIKIKYKNPWEAQLKCKIYEILYSGRFA